LSYGDESQTPGRSVPTAHTQQFLKDLDAWTARRHASEPKLDRSLL